jgi:glucosamine--fructose-6-phosphate aminotransferase (isomerizing)
MLATSAVVVEPEVSSQSVRPLPHPRASATVALHSTDIQIMCGIIGYIGSKPAVPILLDGLRRLEYRGYDSAGVATLAGGKIEVRKCIGRIANLAELIQHAPPEGNVGISHTRWATHGGVTDENAHPHTDQSGKLVICHNGVIENYATLREQLVRDGHVFTSQTDTEVLAHLVGKAYDAAGGEHTKARLVEAVRTALKQVVGTYGIVVLHRDVPNCVVGARRGSPLVLGVGSGENFFASDVSAIVAHTREAVYLKDFDIATIERDRFEITSLLGGASGYEVSKVEFSEEDVSKGDYAHYMLKEIHEQPATILDAMRGRLSREEATAKLGGLDMTPQQLREVDRIILTGCGTACHAAMCGEYIIEALAHVPVEVEFASEFRYRNLPLPKHTLVFCISQSGETADTLAALRESQRKGLRTLGICNNVGSTIARENDGGVYMHAGPEIGVAATKSFTSQVTILTLIALLLGRIRHMSVMEGLRIIDELEALPDKVRRILALDAHIKAVAEKYAHAQAMMFLGRQFNYPVALEGALKMKEISYIHASGHPSAELKHGVIALITPELPTVVVAPEDSVLEKNISNIEEVRARKGPIIAIGTEGCTKLERVADDFIGIPHCPDYLSPILTSIPLQMLAYHTAVTLGCDVDKPRNLAKSVTVE